MNPDGIKSAEAIRLSNEGIPAGIAGRIEMVMWLLNPETEDEFGNIIHSDPIISIEEAKKLLYFPD